MWSSEMWWLKVCLVVLLLQWSAISPGLCGSSTAEELLIVPGKSVGKISLGMTSDDVIGALGKPDKQQAPRWVEYSQNGAPLDVFFRKGIVDEIRFGNKKYKTAEGLSLTSFSQKKFLDDFECSRLQWKFMNTRYRLKSGGLSFFKLNLDSTDPENKVETMGLVYGEHALHEPVSIEGEKDGGWEEWDGTAGTLWNKFKRHILPTGYSNMLQGN